MYREREPLYPRAIFAVWKIPTSPPNCIFSLVPTASLASMSLSVEMRNALGPLLAVRRRQCSCSSVSTS